MCKLWDTFQILIVLGNFYLIQQVCSSNTQGRERHIFFSFCGSFILEIRKFSRKHILSFFTLFFITLLLSIYWSQNNTLKKPQKTCLLTIYLNSTAFLEIRKKVQRQVHRYLRIKYIVLRSITSNHIHVPIRFE